MVPLAPRPHSFRTRWSIASTWAPLPQATGPPTGTERSCRIWDLVWLLAIKYNDRNEGLNHSDLLDEVISHCELAGTPYLLVDGAQTNRWQEASIPIHPMYGIGDISFYGNDKGLLDDFEGWCTNSYPCMSPLSFDDVLAQDFIAWPQARCRTPSCYCTGVANDVPIDRGIRR